MNNVLQRPVFKLNWGCMYQGWRDCIIIIIIMGRKLIENVCIGCGCQYMVAESEIKRGNGKFCTKDCNYEFRKINSGFNIICKNCNKHFKSGRSNKKFCSQKCSCDYNNKTLDRKNHMSEDGKRRIAETNIRLSKARYSKNPKYCKKCNILIGYENRHRVCCNECIITHDGDRKMTLQQYRTRCKFAFSLNNYPEEFDFKLIEEFGWYSPSNKKNNLNGVSRDHMISVRQGYDLLIDPNIISHPANCRLIKQRDNSSKHSRSSISLIELIKRIEEWDNKYGLNVNGRPIDLQSI